MRVAQGPLRSRNFRLLLACNVISVTGTAFAIVAVPFAVLAIGGSAADVGYVAAAVMVPALIFPLGGVVADRLPRHQVMMAANVLQAVAQAGAAALVLAGRARVWELEIPPAKLSRLSSYDLLASFTLAPLGAVVAGPAANAFGTPAVLTAGGLLIVLLTVTVLFIPEVRHMRRQVHAHPGHAGTLTP
jgi:Transmembrane secretion effector